MFSGIIDRLGTIASWEEGPAGRVLWVDAAGWAYVPAPGASVAVSGCCLTMTQRSAERGMLRFDVIHQTLRVTTLGALRAGDPVNLEGAVTPATRLDGHIVQGHVDGVATVQALAGGAAERRLRVEPPAGLMPCVVERGSVALDGVSLTVASLGPSWFEVALIPATIDRTTLGRAVAGSRLNLEVDYLVKIVRRSLGLE